MSTVRVVNLQHPDSVEPNVILNTDGTATFASGVTVSGFNNITVSGTAEFASGTVVNESGHIGIGITNPTANLQISLPATDSSVYFKAGGSRGLQINDATINNDGDHTRFNKASATGQYTFNNNNGAILQVGPTAGTIKLNGSEQFGSYVTIADDAFATFTPGRNGGFLTVAVNPYSSFPAHGAYTLAWIDFGSSPTNNTAIVAADTTFINSGTPTGTTGADGDLTIFLGGTDGTFYIENRLGGPMEVMINLF